MNISELKATLSSKPSVLGKVYLDKSAQAAQRFCALIGVFEDNFPERDVRLFSTPGRTEIGGNHTDHQKGCVLAAAIDLDIIAVVSPNSSNKINLISDGYPPITLDLSVLSAQQSELETTASLVRGIAAKLCELGAKLSGFNAAICSEVLSGSGLSSSAAFEVLIASIFNSLFCGDKIDPVTLAKVSQYSENVYFGKASGLMDQTACAVGGIVAIDFGADEPIIERIDFDFEHCGYKLCIIDTLSSHDNLSAEYSAMPHEMKTVAKFFGCDVLSEVEEKEFFAHFSEIRDTTSDRAMLRSMHYFAETKRAVAMGECLKNGDFEGFLALVRDSGKSSYELLQNVVRAGSIDHQSVAVAIALAEKLLGAKGAVRIHGGGLAGTIAAFVPENMTAEFASKMERFLAPGCAHQLKMGRCGGGELKI